MHFARSGRWLHPLRWLVLLALLGVLGEPQRATAAGKVVTDADKGGSIHLKTGEAFELRLTSNPSTGYMWYVEKESTSLLKLVHQSQAEIPDSGEPGEHLVGRPVFQVFKVEARRPGQGILLLHYVRSWEPATPDDQQFALHVVVE